MKRNPVLKKGDIVVVQNDGNGFVKGDKVRVTSVYAGYYNVVSADKRFSGTYTLNESNSWDFETRKERIQSCKDRVDELKKELKEEEEELVRLTKFETDEDYTAFKLTQILKNKDDPKAIAKILKELKSSDYL